MTQLMLMIGTRKGAFLAFTDPGRKTWGLTGPIFKGVQVDHVAYAPDVGGAIVVTGTSAWWGPGLQISIDLDKTWQERSSNPVREEPWTLRGTGLDDDAGAHGDRGEGPLRRCRAAGAVSQQ